MVELDQAHTFAVLVAVPETQLAAEVRNWCNMRVNQTRHVASDGPTHEFAGDFVGSPLAAHHLMTFSTA